MKDSPAETFAKEHGILFKELKKLSGVKVSKVSNKVYTGKPINPGVTVIEDNFIQFENAPLPIPLTPLQRLTLFKDVQPSNIQSEIYAFELYVTDSKPVQSANMPYPTSSIFAGIVTLVSLMQP